MKTKTMKKYSGALAAMLMFAFNAPVHADEMRSINAIRTPAEMPANAVPMDQVRPVDREIVQRVIEDLFAAWNRQDGQELSEKLHPDFYDKRRVLDAIDTNLPRDAKIRVLSISGIDTQQQYLLKKVRTSQLVSIVAAIIETQIEFNDPAEGLQFRKGLVEYVFEVKERLRP